MEDCIFCKIIKGEIPSEKVYEDDEILAFKDIQPTAPIHILIIPKKHITNLMEVAPEDSKLMGKIVEAMQKVAKQLGVDEKGFRIISNCGPDSGQEVMHLHFHLLAGRKMGPKIAG
jgi:histidine triad (HIT) family protein